MKISRQFVCNTTYGAAIHNCMNKCYVTVADYMYEEVVICSFFCCIDHFLCGWGLPGGFCLYFVASKIEFCPS